MKNIILFVTITLMLTGTVQADVPPEQRTEVEHLLQFVQNSSCKVDRNGSIHYGREAVSHIKKKYDYFRNKIKNTEDFIKYSATKSTMSGKYYTVLCDGQRPVRTRDWLLGELESYRISSRR